MSFPRRKKDGHLGLKKKRSNPSDVFVFSVTTSYQSSQLNARLARAHFILVFSHDTLFRWTISIGLLDQKGSFNGSRR